MSLGPPFDESDSSERLRLVLGLGMAAVLLFFAGFAILAAERSLGDSLTLHIDVTRIGTLHAGAPLRLAGEQIGEVVAIRGQRAEVERTAGPEPRIDIEVRVLRRFRERVRRNSTVVTVNPTLLTEAQLEVGPPWNGEAPGDPVQDGDHLRGVDPAEMSLLLVRLYRGIEAVLHEAKDLSPDWHDVGGALSTLAAHVRETMPTAELLRLALHIERARRGVIHLRDTLEAGEADTAPERLRRLYDSSRPLAVELSRFASQLEALQVRVLDLQAALTARRGDLQRIETLVATTVQLGERVRKDSQALLWLVENGRGTLGGFSRDIQIFDELKEMHRILKRESWRVLIKRKPR